MGQLGLGQTLPSRKMQPAAVSAPMPLGLYALLVLLYAGVTGTLALASPTTTARAQNVETFEMRDRLSGAQAYIRTAGTTRACTWHSGDQRFTCADDPWAFIGPYAGQTDGRALRCTWMHPQAGGATTILRWNDIAMGERISGRLALMDDVGPGADVHLRVFVDESPVVDAVTPESRAAAQFDSELPPGGTRGNLRVELTAADHAWRLACAELVMTGQRRAPTARQGRGRHG